MQPSHLNISIQRGERWRKSFLIMQPTFAYKPITAINQTAPLTVSVTHDLPAARWPVWFEATTSSALNTDKTRQMFRMATVIDPQTIELNPINGTEIAAAGGQLVYRLPVDLTTGTATLEIIAPSGTTDFPMTIALGMLEAELTEAETQALEDRSTYNIWVTSASGIKQKWLCGEVVLDEC